MGTTYQIKINTKNHINEDSLKLDIDNYLYDINMVFSTYIDSSEISMINTSLENKFLISEELKYVLFESLYWADISSGLYDPTVYPLVDLWGFAGSQRTKVPTEYEIQDILDRVSYKNISLVDNILNKKNDVYLDLSSIAKGYAVDLIASKLIESGYNDFLVDIGGELFCNGNNNNNNWIVGIAHPNENELFLKTIINDFSIATSGTYNNYTIYEGKEYSHLINPITGYPILNSVVSATVLSKNCTTSDAIATMLMVLPYDKGLDIVNGIDNVECMILINKDDGILKLESSNFKDRVIN